MPPRVHCRRSGSYAAPAAYPGWGCLPALLSRSHALTAAASVPPSSAPASGLPGGSSMVRLAYTCLSGAAVEEGCLLAGTSDARVCVLDLESQRLTSEWLAGNSLRWAMRPCIHASTA